MPASLTIDGHAVEHVTLYDVSVTCGRDDVEAQADGSALDATVEGYIDVGAVGSSIVLADTLGVMFQGTITDLQADLVYDVVDTSRAIMHWRTRVTATGPLARLGHIFVGALVDYPAEDDIRRIMRVFDEAGVPVLVDESAAGLDLLPRTAESIDAGSLARDTATNGLGVLWEQPADLETPIRYTPHALRSWGALSLTWDDTAPLPWANMSGSMRWRDWNSENMPSSGEAAPVLDLRAVQTLAEGVSFTQGIGDLARLHRVIYGEVPVEIVEGEPVEGERAVYVAGEGYPEREHDTQLATLDDANEYGEIMLRRHGSPTWRLQSIRVALHGLVPSERERIRGALAVGAQVTVRFPHGSPVGEQWQGFLEGWEHSLTGERLDYRHVLTMKVSDRRLTEPTDRWDDITPATTWGALSTTLTWDDAISWE